MLNLYICKTAVNNSDITKRNIMITNTIVHHILARYSYLPEDRTKIPETYRGYYKKIYRVFWPYYTAHMHKQ